MIRKHIVFTGQAHGVGFRRRARLTAWLYNCTGWCRNEWDGTVTMEIQGSEDAVHRMIQGIQGGRSVKISETEVTEIPVRPEERGVRTE